MTRKHFQELVQIIVDNNLDEQTQNDIISFCKRHNTKFNKFMFLNAVEKAKQ